MSDKYHSGSDMYKKHRDLIASIMEQAEKFEDEIDHVDEIDEPADHPEDCRCKMCKPSISEGDEDELDEDLKDYKDDYSDLDESADHTEDCRCKMCKPSIYETEEESGKDFIEKAKKEIEEESDLAHQVAEEHGQMLDNVAHMSWFIQEVADKLKDQEPLDEAMRGVIDSNYELKKHIANNFDFYKDNIMRLYPEDMKNTKEVFLRFLKGQELDQDKLESLSASLEKKIRNTGDAYDEMSQFIELVKRFPK